MTVPDSVPRQIVKFHSQLWMVNKNISNHRLGLFILSMSQVHKFLKYLYLTLPGCKEVSCLRVFLYNAKPSFEIAKWMANNMLWQNIKINKIMQKT